MSDHTYAGEKLTIHFDTKKCIHAGECVRGNPAVFNPDNRPWVSPDATDPNEVAATVTRCPTGALTFERHDDDAAETHAERNTVEICSDGPVYLRGDLRIQDSEDNVQSFTRVALCRCGATKNGPFCDNSHGKADFADPGKAREIKSKDAPEGQTFLKARVLANGPVLLEGPYQLIDGQGEVCLDATSGFLCRCGASENKPWCDGAHNRVGFKEEGKLS